MGKPLAGNMDIWVTHFDGNHGTRGRMLADGNHFQYDNRIAERVAEIEDRVFDAFGQFDFFYSAESDRTMALA